MDTSESQMKTIIKSMDYVIMTIPGLDFDNGGMILGLIGDIFRFPNPSKFAAPD